MSWQQVPSAELRAEFWAAFLGAMRPEGLYGYGKIFVVRIWSAHTLSTGMPLFLTNSMSEIAFRKGEGKTIQGHQSRTSRISEGGKLEGCEAPTSLHAC